MKKIIGGWSLYHSFAFLTLVLTGSFLTWSASRSAVDTRLLSKKEQQIIICGDTTYNPGRCHAPSPGDECNKTNVYCDSEDSYCQEIK